MGWAFVVDFHHFHSGDQAQGQLLDITTSLWPTYFMHMTCPTLQWWPCYKLFFISRWWFLRWNSPVTLKCSRLETPQSSVSIPIDNSIHVTWILWHHHSRSCDIILTTSHVIAL